MTILAGDCRVVMPRHTPFDMIMPIRRMAEKAHTRIADVLPFGGGYEL